MFEATYKAREAKGEFSFLFGGNTEEYLAPNQALYLTVIDEKATSVSQTKDTFLKRNKTEITTILTKLVKPNLFIIQFY